MSEKVCRYCKDEFCVNADCPMRADYCPVPDNPGVCRYEERVDSVPMTPKECLAAAFNDCGQEMRESEVEEVFDSLVKILGENGFAIQSITQSEPVEEEHDRLISNFECPYCHEWHRENAVDQYCTSCGKRIMIVHKDGKKS